MLNLKIELHLSTFIAPTIFIIHFSKFRSSHLEVLCKKGVIINFVKFTGKHLCQRLFFNNVSGLRPATFLEKESLIQVFSHGFCEMSKNSFFYRTPPVAASASCTQYLCQYFLNFQRLQQLPENLKTCFFLNDCLKFNQSNKKIANLLTNLLRQELCERLKNLG